MRPRGCAHLTSRLARRLYERVAMTVLFRADSYERPLDVGRRR